MDDYLDVSSIYDAIDAPQFHYDGVHIFGTEFYKDMLITMGKNWDKEENY